jgi:hypothetical protein
LQADAVEPRRTALAERSEVEQKEFAVSFANAPKPEEQVGRTSGDKEWREQRGELGATAEAKARALECSETGIVSSSGEKVNFKTDSSSIKSSTASDDRQHHKTLIVPDGFEELSVFCRWKDQGFGNQKGRLFVKVERRICDDQSCRTDVICDQDCFGLAPHEWEMRRIQFSAKELNNPQANDEVKIEYIVGGGGGHQLMVEDLKVAIGKKAEETPATSSAATASAGYAVTAAPAASTNKEDMQALVKKAFAELVASGVSPNEAAAKAIEQAKKEQLQALTKKLFAELVASGMAANDAAIKAMEKAKEQMK